MPDDVVFNQGMAVLSHAYPDYDCSPATVDVYREFLKNLSNQEFEFAINLHTRKNKWFPKISELLDAVRTLQPSAAEMWAWLKKMAAKGQKPEMDIPTAAGLEAIGGWTYLCYTDVDKLSFSFKIFEDAYKRGQDGLAGGGVPVIEHRPAQLEEP